MDEIELTDEQLEMISGGEIAVTVVVCCIIGGAALGAGILVGTYL